MAWRRGTTSEAIAEAKRSSKIFIVYITDDNEESQQMDAIWENDEIKELCQLNCICLMLSSNDTDCKQFVEKFNKDPDLSVPTTCVFAADGSPLEIFAGVMDENDLKKKIKNAAQNQLKKEIAKRTTVMQIQEIEERKQKEIFKKEELKRAREQAEEDEEKDSKNYEKEDEARRIENTKLFKEKIAQEKILMRENVLRAQKEGMKEIKRRKTGQQYQKMLRIQEDKRRKLEIENIKKEKILNEKALERVREQIKQDRNDVEARITKEKVLKKNEEKATRKQCFMKEKDLLIQNEKMSEITGNTKKQFQKLEETPQDMTTKQKEEKLESEEIFGIEARKSVREQMKKGRERKPKNQKEVGNAIKNDAKWREKTPQERKKTKKMPTSLQNKVTKEISVTTEKQFQEIERKQQDMTMKRKETEKEDVLKIEGLENVREQITKDRDTKPRKNQKDVGHGIKKDKSLKKKTPTETKKIKNTTTPVQHKGTEEIVTITAEKEIQEWEEKQRDIIQIRLEVDKAIAEEFLKRKAVHRLRDQITQGQEQMKYLHGVKVTRVKKQKSTYNSNSQCLVS